MMTEKILLVDDELNILQSMQRQLRKRFEIMIAESGDEALATLQNKGPFAVIVSDMRMPGMDGIQLLTRVKDSYPDTVRIMLTGNADQETASEAVNAGQIFRFLTKPCSTAVLATSLALAVRQYNLLTAEKELLNKTVKGSITVMAELLSLANATAFSSGYRIKPMVTEIAKELQLPSPWQYEVAALMSQIGCITLPSDVLHKLQAGFPLTAEERHMYENHPKVGSKLIRKIPRLEKVAEMIANQLHSFEHNEEESLDEEIVIGAEILRATIDYDLLRQQDIAHHQAIGKMRKQEEKYNPEVLAILGKHEPEDVHTAIRNLCFKDVIPGMIAVEDVFAKNGAMLISKGQTITWPVIQSLTNFEKQIGIVEPIRVRTAALEE
ncbi:CheY-like receiver and HD-GYP domain-containing response regulator [Desulfocapsa sulfexigens DSM 10523]|uniref:CheY-like receiver and HD-GYP domain-containing response regulator n=1 Tax=Desulfocapsa sulfexigens (strain DSM 10523 / SB164P1) TaxID=1167006 RepID=M1P859_DESSD|nr:HD domain-containing phosphohydrolase [Desulfocapsa sulfexigens]AGF77862.1 CheY-like receiver and HD-GYP domain-containing response regulator [Desulfocapsa sulfexigens DSM 10523]